MHADSSAIGSIDAQPDKALPGHWVFSAHRTEASEISAFALRAGLGEVQVWAVASAMRLTLSGLARMLRTEGTIREMSANAGTMPARDQQLIALLRTIAARHAEPTTSVAAPPPSQSVERLRPTAAPPPPPASGTSATAAASPPWNEKRINAGIDQLARDRGITQPLMIKVMKSLLVDPSLAGTQRAISLGSTANGVAQTTSAVRAVVGNESENLRTRLAELVGMPFSELVARIKVPGDLSLTKRVIDTIHPSHREAVAKSLLSAQAGGDREVLIYRVMDAIFHGGDPFVGAKQLAKQADQPASKQNSSTTFLQQAFGSDRITMLRNMGFGHEQILSMNPVGAELGKRFDPALGTYSAAETAARRSKNLPCTREEAAERLLRGGTVNFGKQYSMSYRTWLTVGLVSDKPSSMSSDISAAFASVVPGASALAGYNDLNLSFRIAEVLLNRKIPRGMRPDLQDRNYRDEINLLLLQTFGLGATRVGSGRLEPIPTEFKVSDWPSPVEPPERSRRAAPAGEKTVDEVTWQQLLPLLQRRSIR